MASDADIQHYINKLDENQVKQLYNLNNEELKPHIIQFKQLIEYFNFKIKIKSLLSNPNNKGETLKEIYLIDKRWLKKWKKHVGYDAIKGFFNKVIKKEELENTDYEWVERIINNNTHNLLSPLDNFNIYDNKGELDIYSEFILVNQKCFKLFSLGGKKSNFQLINNYQITIFFGKLLLKIDKIKYLLKFKEQNKKFELIISFISGKGNINGFLNILANNDINVWIKNLGFDLYSTESKKVEQLNMNILNKTLLSKKIKGNIINKEDNINKAVLNVTCVISNDIKNMIIMDDHNLRLQSEGPAFFGDLEKRITMTSQTKQVINRINNQNLSDQSNINRKDKKKNKLDNFKTEVNNTRKRGGINPLTETMAFIYKNQRQAPNSINEFEYVNYMRESIPKENTGNLNSKTFNNNSFNIINNNFNIIIGNNNNNNFNNNGFNNNMNNFNNNNFFSANAINNNFNNNLPQNGFCNSMGNLGINNINMNNMNNFMQDNNNMNLNNNNNFNNFNNNNVNNFNNNNNFNNDFNNCNNGNFNNNNLNFNDSNPNFNNNQIVPFNNNNNNFSGNMNMFNNSGNNNNMINNNMMDMNNNMNQFNGMNGMNDNNMMNMNNNMNQFNGMNMNQFNGMNGMNNNNMMNMMDMNNNMNQLNNMNNMNMFNPNMNMNNNMNNMNFNNNMNAMNMFNNMFNGFNFNNNGIMNNLNSKTEIKTQLILPPHKVGLQNIGQTCYMNASLQCLTNVQRLTNKLLEMHSQNKINAQLQPLTQVYTNLLFEFNTTNKSYIIPNTFKAVLENLNPLFQGNQASDAKDFIFFIIERLHQELKPPDNPPNNFVQINFLQQELEARNENLTREKFLKEFKTKNTSIISENFYGITRSVMKCDACGVQKFSFQTFNILSFILKKVKEEKQKDLGGYLPNDYVINLIDAFDSENKLEHLVGENMIYCNNCKALKNGSIKQDIYQLPRVMIIVLNRGKNNQDFREEFDIKEILTFQSPNTIICNPQTYHQYYLCGVITHLGESGSNGHFISYFRTSMNQRFYCYNDAAVAEVSVEDAIKTKISYNADDDIIPYILFYHYHGGN